MLTWGLYIRIYMHIYAGVVGPYDDQSRLYEGCSDVVQDALAGVNCSIIAYGQTGIYIHILWLKVHI